MEETREVQQSTKPRWTLVLRLKPGHSECRLLQEPARLLHPHNSLSCLEGRPLSEKSRISFQAWTVLPIPECGHPGGLPFRFSLSLYQSVHSHWRQASSSLNASLFVEVLWIHHYRLPCGWWAVWYHLCAVGINKLDQINNCRGSQGCHREVRSRFPITLWLGSGLWLTFILRLELLKNQRKK